MKLAIFLLVFLSMSRVAAEPDPHIVDCLHIDSTYYVVQEFHCGSSYCSRSGASYKPGSFTQIPSGRYFWNNAQYRFEVPGDIHPTAMYRFLSRSEAARFLWVYEAGSTPNTLYVVPYQSMREYADAQGQHYGPHPCGAYEVPRSVWQAALNRKG